MSAYGLRRSSKSRDEIDARVAELLTLVGLQGFERRRVTSLSGGEQQRVAIARALAPSPVLLLLDEPLAALDEKIRREMQAELRRIQATTGTAFVYVTHDQEEALTISDRIAVLNKGRLVQLDRPEALFRRPRTRFVAEFFRGCNVLDVDAANDHLSLAGSSLPVGLSTADGAQALAVRGEAIRLGTTDGDLTLQADLEAITYRGLYYDYRLRLGDGQTLSAITTEARDLDIGASMPIAVNAADLVLLEQD